MNKARVLRQQLGAAYTYTRLLSAKEVRQLQARPPQYFSQRTVAVLTAGCLKLDLVLFRTAAGLELGYDLYVKDDPTAGDWICYKSWDAVNGNAKENSMAAVLDAAAQQSGLSYTVCCFEQLDGSIPVNDSTDKTQKQSAQEQKDEMATSYDTLSM